MVDSRVQYLQNLSLDFYTNLVILTNAKESRSAFKLFFFPPSLWVHLILPRTFIDSFLTQCQSHTCLQRE